MIEFRCSVRAGGVGIKLRIEDDLAWIQKLMLIVCVVWARQSYLGTIRVTCRSCNSNFPWAETPT
jgi:hypothetical protein